MSSASITFGVICGLAGLVFGIVEQSISLYVLRGLAIGVTCSVCLQFVCDVKDIN